MIEIGILDLSCNNLNSLTHDKQKLIKGGSSLEQYTKISGNGNISVKLLIDPNRPVDLNAIKFLMQ
jgi:hypothetical protein